MFTIGEDFWVQNERGENVFKVDQELLRIRETFALQDVNGNELATVDRKILAIQPTMNIERNGQVWATVRKSLFTLLRQHFSIEVAGGGELEAQGDILNHEYEITGGGQTVATVSKRWFTIRETYGIAIAPGQDQVLLLCAAVCIDELSEAERNRS
ncbi:MAG TPA: LURP-one-related family protein [Candidatus Dormibacteraeota bacterium]|nr:LURP-one-related family protein [Candidatus Dormibacteraeota bacterium]